MTTTYQQLGTQIGELVAAKNAAYGSSFAKSGEFLRLLFPSGVPADRAEDALLLVRIFDKAMRIATDQDAFGESPYQDIAGYGILGAQMHHERKSKECGSVNAAGAAGESKAQGNSAAQSAAPMTTPNASEPSENASRKPSTEPLKHASEPAAAPAETATETVSVSVEDLAALAGLGRAARAWHDEYHVDTMVPCDGICNELLSFESAMARIGAL